MNAHSSVYLCGLYAFVAALALLSPSTKASQDALSYGYICNETVHCDFNKSLTCRNGSCECRIPDAMKYDLDLASCVVLANKSCFIEDQVSLTLKDAISLEPPGERQLSCIKNAVCDNKTKLCLCDELLMPSENGTCIPKKLINGNCSSSSECRQDLGLICDGHVCYCDPKTTINDDMQSPWKACVGKAENPCIKDMCTANARCVDISDGIFEDSETTTTAPAVNNNNEKAPHSKVCQCAEEYDPTPFGRCARDYGIKCDGIRGCKPGFTCGEDGFCQCHHPAHQVYDEFKGACVSLIEGPCNANVSFDLESENHIACISGGVCLPNNVTVSGKVNQTGNPFAYKCQCGAGFIQNRYRGCDLGFETACREESTNGGDEEFRCHVEGKLTCVLGSCQCEDALFEYDKREVRCVGLIGASCSLQEAPETGNGIEVVIVGQKEDINENITERGWCTRGAKCVPGEDGITGTCQCTDRVIGEGKCSDKDVPVMVIIAISLATVISGMIVICCYFYVKRQGLLVSNALD